MANRPLDWPRLYEQWPNFISGYYTGYWGPLVSVRASIKPLLCNLLRLIHSLNSEFHTFVCWHLVYESLLKSNVSLGLERQYSRWGTFLGAALDLIPETHTHIRTLLCTKKHTMVLSHSSNPLTWMNTLLPPTPYSLPYYTNSTGCYRWQRTKLYDM